jgi:hypothetical protein
MAELDRRRLAQPIPPSRNAYATYLLGLALDSDTRAASPKHIAQRGGMGTTDPPPHLLDVRRRLGLRQRDVAERAGVSVDKVRRAEKGAPTPPELRAWVEEQERVAKGGAA